MGRIGHLGLRSRGLILAGICAALFLGCVPSGWAQTPQSPDPLVGQYYGLFGKTNVHSPLVEQVEQLPQLFKRNPYLKGLTIRTNWKELEPEEGRFNWVGMDRLVKWTQKDQLHMNIELAAGALSPDWIYAKGAKAIEWKETNPSKPTFGQTMKSPIPWDETYKKFWRRLVAEVAKRYGNEPNLLDVNVYGHNHKLEMHMAHDPDDMARWKQAGWSVELVEREWKEWIDFFAATFSKPRITLILSPTYDHSTDSLVGELANYAIKKYPGRIMLMTCVLNGRGEGKGMVQVRACLEHPEVPNTHEFLASFGEVEKKGPLAGRAKRQGSVEMTVYNMRRLSPLFVRPWTASEIDYCARIAKEYEHARTMSLEEYKNELQQRGLFGVRSPDSTTAAKKTRAKSGGPETAVTIKKLDADKGTIVVTAKGKDYTLTIAKDVTVLGIDDKALTDGIKSMELKEGVQAMINYQRDGGTDVLKEIRLGKGQEKRRKTNADPNASKEGKPNIGLRPLNEMTAEDRYKGEDGGLYGGGQNEPPAALLAAAKAATAKIVPLDEKGQPAKDGKIGLISLSYSNATREFAYFKPIADADPQKSPFVQIVDCSQSGQAMEKWVDPKAKPWMVTDQRLASARLSPEQVQVVWTKIANIQPKGDLPEHGKKLQKDTTAYLQNAHAHFPNLRIIYISSRDYGGWTNTLLNPEPYAYEQGFVIRWLIQAQMKGDPELNPDPAKGPVKAPLLLWGPYMWGDGTTPRKSDGLVWERKDFVEDGTHVSESGKQKVCDMLLKHFKGDALCKTWYGRK